MNVDNFKFFAAAVILVLNGLSSVLPLCIKSRKWVSCAESLAGGVFLGAAMVHLIPESLHSFEGITHKPVAPIISLIFFVIMLCIEMFASSHPEESDSGDSQRLLPSGSNEENPVNIDELGPVYSKVSNRVDSVTMVLYYILIFHGAVEAVAFGIMNSESVVIALFCAIIGHKPVETFALGLMLLKSVSPGPKYFTLMGIFSMIAPITVVFTMWIGKMASATFFGVIASASSGAFLFVGCHELCEMLHHSHKWTFNGKLWHLGSFMIGVAWMGIIGMMGGEHHH